METLKKKSGAPSMKLYDNPRDAAKIWEVREAGLGASAWVPGQHLTWEGWEDSAVPPEKLGPYLRELCELYDAHGYKGHSMVISARVAFTRASRSISIRRRESRSTGASWTMRRRSSRNTAALFPESMAMASQKPNSSIKCSARN